MRTVWRTVATAAVAGLLAALDLPRLSGRPEPDAHTQRAFEEFTARFVDPPGSPRPLQAPGDTLTYLRWLATHRAVLFHGSRRGGIGELRPDRESRDASPFGNQRAVFASDDPVWAMWFALLNRGPGFRSTRNGVLSAGDGQDARWYFFSVDMDRARPLFVDEGWLYVVPRDGFTVQPSLAGVLHSAQWVSPDPVRPLARFAVTPSDFPFADHVTRHTRGDSMVKTLWNARTSARRRAR
ncbi:hypothetical protein [Thermasporomyces composti]|nr:hypothetical protein [Thermasporomyces composti]